MAINYFVRLPNVCFKVFDQLSNPKIYKLVDWRYRGAGHGALIAIVISTIITNYSIAFTSRDCNMTIMMTIACRVRHWISWSTISVRIQMMGIGDQFILPRKSRYCRLHAPDDEAWSLPLANFLLFCNGC